VKGVQEENPLENIRIIEIPETEICASETSKMPENWIATYFLFVAESQASF